MPRGRPQNDSEQTRTQLLETAAQLFNSVSYFETNTNKIAKAAGFAPATFYRHFADKKEIFLSCYTYWVNENWLALENVKGGGDDYNAKEKAETLIRHHHRWKGYRRNLYALAATDDEAHAFIRNLREKQIELLIVKIAESGADISRSSALYSFFCIERAINALVDGDVSALNIDETKFIERIAMEINFLETGSICM